MGSFWWRKFIIKHQNCGYPHGTCEIKWMSWEEIMIIQHSCEMGLQSNLETLKLTYVSL